MSTADSVFAPHRDGWQGSGPVALAVATVVWLSVVGSLGYGCMHYQHLAVAQRMELQRVAQTNLNLQDELTRLRDQSREKLLQLNAERYYLHQRIDGLQQTLSSVPTRFLPRGIAKPTAPARSAAAATAVISGTDSKTKNFATPEWAPDYFDNEGAGLRPAISNAKGE